MPATAMMCTTGRTRPGWKSRSIVHLLLSLAFVVLCHDAVRAGTPNKDRIVIKIEKGPNAPAPPLGWQVKNWNGRAAFNVINADSRPVIHLKSESTSGALYKDSVFDITDFPVLHWRWKVTKLPAGADVRARSTDDQAVQLYVIFPVWPERVNSRVLGYIWDSNAPVGGKFTSKKTPRTKYIVIRSGPEGLGRWQTHKRNVYEDYRTLFGEEPPMVGKISVMIDSDDMRDSAESFIGDIYFSRVDTPPAPPAPPAR